MVIKLEGEGKKALIARPLKKKRGFPNDLPLLQDGGAAGPCTAPRLDDGNGPQDGSEQPLAVLPCPYMEYILRDSKAKKVRYCAAERERDCYTEKDRDCKTETVRQRL